MITVSGRLDVKRAPGFTYRGDEDGLELMYTGAQGVRELSKLIEKATALKAGLEAKV